MKTSEPKIVINGTELTEAQAMTVRVAVGGFMMEVSQPGCLGDDEQAEDLRRGYGYRLREISRIMLAGMVLLLTGCGFEMKMPPTTVCVMKGELMCNQASVYECTGLVWKWRADCDEATCNYEVRPGSNQWGKCSAETPDGDL